MDPTGSVALLAEQHLEPSAMLRNATHVSSIHGYRVGAHQPNEPRESSSLSMAMIHGMVEDWSVWSSSLDYFSPTMNTYALELPWSGQQGPHWSGSAPARVWLKHAMQHIPTDVDVVVAHSFGALALLQYLCEYGAQDLKGVVLISPFYKPEVEAFSWDLARYYMGNFSRFIEDSIRLRAGGRDLAPERLEAVTHKIAEHFSPYGWFEFMREIAFSKSRGR